MQGSFEPGAVLEIEIGAVAHGGDGLGRIHGMVCFVRGALPGDTVRARIYRCAANALWARVISVLEASPYRCTPAACGGRACASACVWRDFTYPTQGEWKRRIVSDNLERIGGVAIEVAFLENPELRLGYRTRAVFHGDGLELGYYKPRSHDVVGLDACPLNHRRLNEALALLRPLGITGDVQVTVNPEGEQTLVWLGEPTARLREMFPLANSRRDRERFQFMFDGTPVVNGAFSQSSLLLNRLLREHTDQCVGKAERLLDLYCGNGNLSLHRCGQSQVTGVDHAGAAIAAATALAPGSYIQGDEQTMARLLEKETWDVVLLDPPRVGAKALVPALATAHADRIVYVSCNPSTLARDLRGLIAQGWKLTQATALDMFPHTPHVESVCVLQR